METMNIDQKKMTTIKSTGQTRQKQFKMATCLAVFVANRTEIELMKVKKCLSYQKVKGKENKREREGRKAEKVASAWQD